MNCIFVIIWGFKGFSDGGFGLYMRSLRLVWGIVCPVYGVCGLDLRIFPDFTPIFYGMKRARVGAFTDFGGSRYRNPVHFLGTFSNFPLILKFSGLVYYTGHFPGGGARFEL